MRFLGALFQPQHCIPSLSQGAWVLILVYIQALIWCKVTYGRSYMHPHMFPHLYWVHINVLGQLCRF